MIRYPRFWGGAIVWRIFDKSGDDLVPNFIHQHVMQAYGDLGSHSTLENDTNPVDKVPMGVDGYDSEVIMDVNMFDGIDGSEESDDIQQCIGMRHQEVCLLSSQVLPMRHELINSCAEFEHQLSIIRSQLTRLNQNLTCFANHPLNMIHRPVEIEVEEEKQEEEAAP